MTPIIQNLCKLLVFWKKNDVHTYLNKATSKVVTSHIDLVSGTINNAQKVTTTQWNVISPNNRWAGAV